MTPQAEVIQVAKSPANVEVSIIIVNFNGKKFLHTLFKSLQEQNYSAFEVIFVDNNSQDNSLNLLETEILKGTSISAKTTIIKLSENVGFAKANNIGVQHAKGEYVLFLNSDTSIQPNAMTYMLKTIKKNSFIAGVTPKIYLSRYFPLQVFDSVGICMNTSGSPYNKGIGQIDLGQYDQEEEVMGICFACALVRKEIFVASGGLDASYFAYFEDVDWSFRVRKLGYSLLCSPKAVVYHYHSGTSSEQSYAWKYYLIFRNYLRTATKSFGKKNMIRIVREKLADFVKAILNPGTDAYLRKSMIKVVLNYIFFDWYVYLFKRMSARKYFISEITDEELFQYGTFEPSNFFNVKTYQPEISLPMLDFIVYRKNHIEINENMTRDWEDLKRSYYCSQYSDKWKRNFEKFLRSYFPNYSDAKLLLPYFYPEKTEE